MNHVLIDDNQIGRVVTAADDRQDVRMRKDAQTGEFFVKVARDARRALPNGQEFGDDVVALPRTSPRITRRCRSQFLVQR